MIRMWILKIGGKVGIGLIGLLVKCVTRLGFGCGIYRAGLEWEKGKWGWRRGRGNCGSLWSFVLGIRSQI